MAERLGGVSVRVFDILRERLEEKKQEHLHDEKVLKAQKRELLASFSGIKAYAVGGVIEIVNQVEQEYNNGWIPCRVAMPPVETEVWIVAKRKWRDGTFQYITTTAIYEDGTVFENNSCWLWEDIEGKWDEENDCYIIPEGWWEWKHYNGDSELNHAVDDEVIAWQPLPEQYKD